jgi:hypothetical protein
MVCGTRRQRGPLEAGMDMPALAALPAIASSTWSCGNTHPPQDNHAAAVKKMEAFNAAKEIAGVEKMKANQERGDTIPATVPENPADFSGKSKP